MDWVRSINDETFVRVRQTWYFSITTAVSHVKYAVDYFLMQNFVAFPRVGDRTRFHAKLCRELSLRGMTLVFQHT